MEAMVLKQLKTVVKSLKKGIEAIVAIVIEAKVLKIL